MNPSTGDSKPNAWLILIIIAIYVLPTVRLILALE
jgi:hypothetical protein